MYASKTDAVKLCIRLCGSGIFWRRAAYYNYYTQNRWGDAHNYDLAINAALGHDACVQMILAAAEAKEKSMEG